MPRSGPPATARPRRPATASHSTTTGEAGPELYIVARALLNGFITRSIGACIVAILFNNFSPGKLIKQLQATPRNRITPLIDKVLHVYDNKPDGRLVRTLLDAALDLTSNSPAVRLLRFGTLEQLADTITSACRPA